MSYRPITDIWMLARPKVPFYGAFPSGFLARARALLGVSREDSVLHVCAGRVRAYPFDGFGVNDKTLDIDPATAPDILMDAREITESRPKAYGMGVRDRWPAVLIDRPYTPEDAAHYASGACTLPEPNDILRRCLAIVRPGGRVGMLDCVIPRPPKDALFIACIGVMAGYGNRMRAYTVFERASPASEAAKHRTLAAVKEQLSRAPTGIALRDEE